MRGALLVALACAAAVILSFPGVASAAVCTSTSCRTAHDDVPNFAGSPTKRAVRSGPWSDPGTWAPAGAPGPGDVVSIANGVEVRFRTDDGRAKVVGIDSGGVLRFATDVTTRLTVGTVLVLPGGTLTLGTEAAPVAPGVRAELVIADQPLDLTRDPHRFGTGLLVIDGRLETSGAARTPFARLAREPEAGDRRLWLAAPVTGWRAGDRLVLPDSRHWPSETRTDYASEREEVVVEAVAPDRLSVALRAPVRFRHPGARDGDGTLRLLPHAANLTRNVILRSQRPAGTRGHVLATGNAWVAVRGAAFVDLGRTTVAPLHVTQPGAGGRISRVGTNQAGRYPLHLHHLTGPSPSFPGREQFRLEGNVVDDTAERNVHKWAITIHDSHHGVVRGNVVRNAAGWGIGTESGNETGIVLEGNIVVGVSGRGGGERSEGATGIWLRGPLAVARDNVVANVAREGALGGIGYELFFVDLGEIRVPRRPGADTTVEAQTRVLDGNAHRLAGFSDNEVYGAIETGLQVWWLGTRDTQPLPARRSVIRDLTIWHHSRYGVYGYPANGLTLDGLLILGDKRVIANRHEFVLGVWFGDYMTRNAIIRRADIQNLRTGIGTPSFARGTTLIERSYLRNALNVVVPTIGAPGSAPDGRLLPSKTTLIRDVRFRAVMGDVGGERQCAIAMSYTTHNGFANLIKPDRVVVRRFNGRSGDDFRVFYMEQAPGHVLPVSAGKLAGAPVAGLTNAQAWARHRIAIAGEVADSAGRRAGICGLVRDLP